MKKLILILVCTALLAACGCTALNAPAADPAPVIDPAPAVDTAAPEPAKDADNSGAYTANITVDNGTELTLALHTVPLEFEQFGVTGIDVFRSGELIQSIDVREAISAEWDEEYRTDSTQAYTEDGGLTVTDMNFDGAGDIGLMGWVTAGANLPYYYWLWNAQSQRFEYAFCLCNAEPDAQNREIVSATREGAGCYVTDRYIYSAEGALTLEKREIEAEGEDAAVSDELTALLSDIYENCHPGTAGCTLTAAGCAGRLLDFYAGAMPEFDHIGAAVCRFFFALDADARAQFIEQLALVYDSALLIAEDGGNDLLESAGYTPEHAPWSSSDAELLFSAVHFGMAAE